MQVQWIIDTLLLEKHDEGFGFPRIEEAVEKCGHKAIITKYIPFSDKPLKTPFNPYEPTILYGSCQFVSQWERLGLLKTVIPGAYFNKEKLKYSNYSSIFGRLMLNDDYYMLPYGEIKRRMNEDLEEGLLPPNFKNKKLFLRPDVVIKSFAGRVFEFDTMEDDVNQLSQYEKISDFELCVISSPKKIIGEYRHVVCNNEIVGQSQYQRDGKLDIQIDVEPECQKLVKYIINNYEQPDNVYVVDTALTEDGSRIVEFNSFSCSGLYAMDTMSIVRNVSQAAIDEYNYLKKDVI
jgi:hypothetical protein